MKLLFATSNMNKYKEAKEIFDDLGLDIELLSLNDLNNHDEVEETGHTFQENSFIKAKHYHDLFHIPTFSDDSGLCVESLSYGPGIFSARYSNDPKVSNNEKLLKEMKNVTKRDAYFICDVCFIDETINHFEGKCIGKIGYELFGENGFGYDPLFIVNYNGEEKTLSELTDEAKNKISHRYNALNKFASFLKNNYCK